jgi:tRNA A37 threonylcarbamoyladenosine dehydratase
MKIDEMKKRLLDINPTCNVTLIHDFIGKDNANEIVESLKPEVDVILDAIDGTNEKAALIAAACYNGVSIVTCGGAAGRVNPTQIYAMILPNQTIVGFYSGAKTSEG